MMNSHFWGELHLWVVFQTTLCQCKLFLDGTKPPLNVQLIFIKYHINHSLKSQKIKETEVDRINPSFHVDMRLYHLNVSSLFLKLVNHNSICSSVFLSFLSELSRAHQPWEEKQIQRIYARNFSDKHCINFCINACLLYVSFTLNVVISFSYWSSQ